MHEHPVPNLEDLHLFNAFLVSLERAHVPLSLNSRNTDLASALSRMDRDAAVRHSKGESVASILADQQLCSHEYRDSLHAWVASGRDASAVEPLVQMGRWRSEVGQRLGDAALEVWIIWVLSTSVLLYMVHNLTPKLRGFYEVSDITPGPSFQLLESIYASWNLWAFAFAAIALLSLWFWRRSMAHSALRWIPKRAQIVRGFFQSATASAPAFESARMAGVPSGPEPTSRTAPGDASRAKLPRWSKAVHLVGWAKDQSCATANAGSAWSLISQLYAQTSRHRAVIGISWLPAILAALTSGCLVLAIGLSLFRPLVETLMKVVSP